MLQQQQQVLVCLACQQWLLRTGAFLLCFLALPHGMSVWNLLWECTTALQGAGRAQSIVAVLLGRAENSWAYC